MSNLILIDGVMGSGKTNLMSMLAKMWEKDSDCTIFSNYGLVGSLSFTRFEDFQQLPYCKSSIVCLDESHLDLSSRDFNLNSVKFFTNMVFYLRKIRCTLMMTTPLIENIDSRVRAVTNIYIHCRSDSNFMYYDWYDMQLEKYLRTKKLNRKHLKNIAPFLYDTFSMVTPLQYPDKREDYIRVLEGVKNGNEEYLRSLGYYENNLKIPTIVS